MPRAGGARTECATENTPRASAQGMWDLARPRHSEFPARNEHFSNQRVQITCAQKAAEKSCGAQEEQREGAHREDGRTRRSPWPDSELRFAAASWD